MGNGTAVGKTNFMRPVPCEHLLFSFEHTIIIIFGTV